MVVCTYLPRELWVYNYVDVLEDFRPLVFVIYRLVYTNHEKYTYIKSWYQVRKQGNSGTTAVLCKTYSVDLASSYY